MTNSAKIWNAVDTLLSAKAKAALSDLDIEPVDESSMVHILARLRSHVPPAYLPFATFEGAPLAFHLLPGRELSDSPIVYIGIGSRSPRFVCSSLADLPIGAWLWIAAFFRSRIAQLRQGIDILSQEIEDGRKVPPELWHLLEQAPENEPTWWGYGASRTTTETWTKADVGHPFAELYQLDIENSSKVVPKLQSVFQKTGTAAPQLLSALLTAQEASGEKPDQDVALRLLAAEAWLGGEPALRTDWHFAEDGLGEWSLALKACDEETLVGTPFEPLSDHPEVYTGSDPLGPDLLREVSCRFGERGDNITEVRQLRNSAFVSLFVKGNYSADDCNKIAAACDRVSQGSLAQQLTLAFGDVSLRDA